MTGELDLKIAQNRTAFEPGDEITGTVGWNLDAPPRRVELRLFWFTRGKGTEDAGVVETVRFENPRASETRPFRVRLPGSPYSFSGKLISLIWALELVAEAVKKVARVELVVAPGAEEVRLGSLPENKTKQRFFVQNRS